MCKSRSSSSSNPNWYKEEREKQGKSIEERKKDGFSGEHTISPTFVRVCALSLTEFSLSLLSPPRTLTLLSLSCQNRVSFFSTSLFFGWGLNHRHRASREIHGARSSSPRTSSPFLPWRKGLRVFIYATATAAAAVLQERACVRFTVCVRSPPLSHSNL